MSWITNVVLKAEPKTYRQRAPPGKHGSEGADPRLQLLVAERTAARVVPVRLRVVVDRPHRSSLVSQARQAADRYIELIHRNDT